jgi:hypothetical protein
LAHASTRWNEADLIERTILTVQYGPVCANLGRDWGSPSLEPRKSYTMSLYHVPPLLPPTDVHHYPTRKGKNFTSSQISSFSTPFTACTVRNVAAVPTLAQPLGPYLVQRNPGTLKPLNICTVRSTVYVPAPPHLKQRKTHITHMAWHGMARSTRMCFPGVS